MGEEEIRLLTELNDTAKKQLEISGLEFTLDPLRYITTKLRTGEAVYSAATYYQLIAAGVTWAITFVNPVGYVWIGLHQGIDTSQSGIFEFTAMVDDRLLPALYIPRLTPIDVNWSQALPFGNIVKTETTITYINHDIVAQWVSVLSVGIFLRKDVWEKDSKLMDEAAEKYIHPAPPPPPMPPK